MQWRLTQLHDFDKSREDVNDNIDSANHGASLLDNLWAMARSDAFRLS
jgi:hypothetical protein